jgi:hypothetical protein
LASEVDVGDGWRVSLTRDGSMRRAHVGIGRSMTAIIGRSDKEIEQVRLWWSAYPTQVDIDERRLSRVRKVIQNDDHDEQNPGSSSRDASW